MKFLPELDSIDYQYRVWLNRQRQEQDLRLKEQAEMQWFRQLLKLLADALRFLSDATVIRGMQLELD